VLPQLTLGLMKAVLGFCIEDHVDTLCAVMAPSLIRLFRGFGLRFEPLGPCVNFHGTRQPCLAAVNDLLRGLEIERPAFFDIVSTGLDNSSNVNRSMVLQRRGENRMTVYEAPRIRFQAEVCR
jgi:N-acyl amino acid synthase of PEP-CTERM/exosortase system